MSRIANKIGQLKFAVYCYKKGKDKRFIKNVKQLDDLNYMVYLESYGEKENDNIVYLIDMEPSYSGFFADHNRLLGYLYFADKYGMKPVVHYSSEYCYAEDYPVNGTGNPFEYYFEQPVHITLDSMKEYKLVARSRKENSYLVNQLCETSNGYMRTEEYLDEMARITAKYIRLNEITNTKISSGIQKLLGTGNALGVHVRGTDFKQNYNGHPVLIGIDDYLSKTVQIFQTGNYDKVFLATDDEEAVKRFSLEFGEQMVFYHDVIRSNEDDTVMHSKVDRENHHYLLGLEVLRDMYTLASCDGLIAGLSQVSYAARIQKKSRGEEYKDLVILNKGVNFHKQHNCTS